VFCAHCGTQNDTDAYSCERCGEHIYQPDADRPPPLGLLECSQCLAANEVRASYCVKCGKSLEASARITVIGGDSSRRAPRSQSGGIRISSRGRETPPQRSPEQSMHDQQERQPRQPTRKPIQPKPNRREAAQAKVQELQRRRLEDSRRENDSGKKSAKLPPSARGWNTAAFLIGPVWGPANGVWLGIVGLVFLAIPESVLEIGWRLTLYLAYGAFLGFRGNELAWRARRWKSLEYFKRVQQLWMFVALIVNIALIFVVPVLLRS
jgi:ribosomal protein L40E